VSQKNDTDVAHYNSDADRPILIIFGIRTYIHIHTRTYMEFITRSMVEHVARIRGAELESEVRNVIAMEFELS